MPPTWFGPPNAHPMRQQQAPQSGSRYHPASGQRMPPAPGNGMTGGVHSPHTFHQRSSPPMRGPYPPGPGHPGPRPHHHPPPPPPPHGVVGHPHGPRMAQGGGGRFPMQQQQHQHQHPPQAMVVGGPRPIPPSAAAAGHSHMARHHAPSPGMPRRMQAPPLNAMRPIPQQPPGVGGPPANFEQHQHQRAAAAAAMQQGGPSHAMQQHMMRLQHEHHQQQQMQQHRPPFHQHPAPSSSDNVHMDNSGSENRFQQHHFQPPPGTPDQQHHYHHQPAGAHSRSPSPPPIPPPHYQHGQSIQHADVSERPSPASLTDNEVIAGACTSGMGEYGRQQQQQTPSSSWNSGPAMGPLRESRLQNMPQKRLVMPMPQQFPPHAQRPHPQHSNGMNPYLNENMERFRAMSMEQKHGGPHFKSLHPHHHHHHQQMMFHSKAETTMASPMQQQSQEPQEDEQNQGPQKKQQGGGKKGQGPDITMDAASMLLALRTSASPSTVSAATLEEQASKDQLEAATKKTTATDQHHHDHDELEDDDVPALASSSSSLSAPPKPCPAPPPPPAVEHHEVPKNFPTRLALPNDEAKLNSLHCFLRSELLEIFVVERSANKSPTHSPGSSVGRVGLRCVFCAMVRKRHALSTTAEHDTGSSSQPHRCDEAPMAVFYPKSIAEIYRLVTSWQRCHLRKCRNLPPDIRSKWTLLRENDKSRGKTHYWITSAKEIGLVDCQSRAGGIRFATKRIACGGESIVTVATGGGADNDSVANDSMHCQIHEDDSIRSNNQSYQPHSNTNFVEGPSQKQREAVAGDIGPTALSVVQSPMKDETLEVKPPSTPTLDSDERSGTDNDAVSAVKGLVMV